MIVCVHDASSASKGRHYAQEGILVMIADGRFRNHTIDVEKIFDDSSATCHGGVMHALHPRGAKAKRVSYSTSHSETLAMVNGVESTTLVSARLSELMHHSPSPFCLNSSVCRKTETHVFQLTIFQTAQIFGNQLHRGLGHRTRVNVSIRRDSNQWPHEAQDRPHAVHGR